ncbi:MAG: hypothetical protein SFX74_08480 [Fimbriimonadaceae bacterium]|nr:hypothetical protein [Fimbriimonadaceae bacterium]
MLIRYLLACRGYLVDPNTNEVALGALVERIELTDPELAWVGGEFSLAALFERTTEEPDELDVIVSLQGPATVRQLPFKVRFSGSRRARLAVSFPGIPNEGPGRYELGVTWADSEGGSWLIFVPPAKTSPPE